MPLASAELDVVDQQGMADDRGEGTGCHLLLTLLVPQSQSLSWGKRKHLSSASPSSTRVTAACRGAAMCSKCCYRPVGAQSWEIAVGISVWSMLG